MNAALFDTFTKGSLESNYEDILRTASLKIVGEKEVAKYTTVGSRGASTLYIWDIDDGKDGTSYLVFVGGSPRVITDSRVAIYDK